MNSQRFIRPIQKFLSGIADSANHLATIVTAAFPRDQFLSFQSVDHARDPGRLFNHAFRNVQGRKPGTSRAPEDSQHVVLLGSYPERFQNLRGTPTDHIRSVQNP
ncbi:MAG TPA: hypothetical protein VER03_21450 [Bryobacteraceae bacterium]|nr:hypothetical protein [Bryobacteraceae bacterium]